MRTITIAIAALSIAGCSASHDPASMPTPAAKPSPTYDGSTISACTEAKKAVLGTDAVDRHSHAARSFAALSDVPALRAVSRKYSDQPPGTKLDGVQATSAAMTIIVWCRQHGITDYD